MALSERREDQMRKYLSEFRKLSGVCGDDVINVVTVDFYVQNTKYVESECIENKMPPPGLFGSGCFYPVLCCHLVAFVVIVRVIGFYSP